jgi:hypothetical protein
MLASTISGKPSPRCCVGFELGPADLHLDGAKAFGEIAVGLLQQRLDREIEVDAAGIAGHARIEPAEQSIQRQFRAPRLQIPQRDVECRKRQHRRPAAAAVMQRPPDLMPDRLGVIGLAALDQRRDFALEDVGDGAAIAPDCVGVADAFGAIGIVDAAGDQLERRDVAMGRVGEHDGEGDPVESGLDV